MIRALGLAMILCGGLAQAQGQTSAEAMTLLRRIYQATENLSYTGTFVYQQGERTETSRITRLAGPGGEI